MLSATASGDSQIAQHQEPYGHFVLCVLQRIVMTPQRMIDRDKEDTGRLCSGCDGVGVVYDGLTGRVA
jgi:hypothetical protein